MESNYDRLISKIDEFRKKFYLNKLLRGLIYTLAISLALYLFLFILIYYFRPSPAIKTFLFFGYLLLLAISTAIGIVKPVLSYLKLSKTLSLEESAEIIGKHFEPIRDKLLNTLQLKAQADLSTTQNQLILAGIDQKINALSPIPFSNAIRLNENKKYLKYLLAPLVLILTVAMVWPVVFKEGSRSFVNYNKEILPAAPFEFVLRNKTMTVTQGDDYLIDLELKGDPLPQEIYIAEGKNTYKLDRKSNSRFSYSFKNLQKDLVFRFNAGGFNSRSYTLAVKLRPSILAIEAQLHYPAYLNKKDELITNAGDMLLPAGTQITWKISTENAQKVLFSLDNKVQEITLKGNETSFSAVVRKNQTYKVVPENNFSTQPDSIQHKIEVIPDLAPLIAVTETTDTANRNVHYFEGNISDDHGFSALKFIYIIKENGQVKKRVATTIPIRPAQQENPFLYYWDNSKMGFKSGQLIEYFLEVSDNDAVNGPKTTRSTPKTFITPTERDLRAEANAESNNLKEKMDLAIKTAAELEKESKKISESLLEKKELSYESKKEVNDLLDKYKNQEEAVKDIQKLKQKITLEHLKNGTVDAELADKQFQINKLFSQISDPKTKELLEKLRGLIDQNKKDELQTELAKLAADTKNMKKELDRVLELYKREEIKQRLNDLIARLNKLTEEQNELIKKTEAGTTSLTELKKLQDKNTQEFNDLKKEMQQLEEKNKALEQPNTLKPTDNESKAVTEQQKKSAESLDKNDKQKAAEAQKKAAEEMKKMAQSLDKVKKEALEKENKLSIKGVRQLLQNILKTSFDQENVMLNLKKMRSTDPAYMKQVQQQREIKDNVRTIADSLTYLSRMVPEIESTVSVEMILIHSNLDRSLQFLVAKKPIEASENQQEVLSSINNLALLLNESLDRLEKEKRENKSGGKGKEQNKDQNKKAMEEVKKMQEQLNKNMEQQKQQLQKKENMNAAQKEKTTENFAKMAQQQQIIRQKLQKLSNDENKDAKDAVDLNQLVKDMQRTEAELINKRIEEGTIKRQEAIMVKMLDADKASRDKKEESPKRESKAGKDFPPSYPKMLEEFQKKSQNEKELLLKTPPTLNYYYKNKISAYFKSLNSPL